MANVESEGVCAGEKRVTGAASEEMGADDERATAERGGLYDGA